MIQLTETAVNALRTASPATQHPSQDCGYLCSPAAAPGTSTRMGLVQAAEEGDVVGESHGVAIFIDPNSVALIARHHH